MGSNQFYLKNEFSEPFYRLPKSGEDLFTFLNTEFLDPIKGIEGFLCPGIDIFSRASEKPFSGKFVRSYRRLYDTYPYKK